MRTSCVILGNVIFLWIVMSPGNDTTNETEKFLKKILKKTRNSKGVLTKNFCLY